MLVNILKTGCFEHSENIQKQHFYNLLGMLAKRSYNIILLAGKAVQTKGFSTLISM